MKKAILLVFSRLVSGKTANQNVLVHLLQLFVCCSPKLCVCRRWNSTGCLSGLLCQWYWGTVDAPIAWYTATAIQP